MATPEEPLTSLTPAQRTLLELEQIHATVENMRAEADKFRAESRKMTREWKLGPYVLAAGMITAIAAFTAALTAIITRVH